MHMNTELSLWHYVLHWMGHNLIANAPAWMHPLLHIVLVITPLALLAICAFHILKFVRKNKTGLPLVAPSVADTGNLWAPGVFGWIMRYSRRAQITLIVSGLAAMPLFYVSLELPKIIINNALDPSFQDIVFLDIHLDQLRYLVLLCAAYLSALILNGAVKFAINVYKGMTGERLLRRLRLQIYKAWQRKKSGKSEGEAIPVIAQEVEPIGGFAADAFALPVFQGGTFLTIIVFMFAQDPILGAAALTLLPVQIAVIPGLQKRINNLARKRVEEVRLLGGLLGQRDQLKPTNRRSSAIAASIRRIEDIRKRLFLFKYFMKALNNFLTALTPFLFYAIGGYLVIEEKLSLGALVAVLAAYKDFSSPLKELFKYYQTREDVRVRYKAIKDFLEV